MSALFEAGCGTYACLTSAGSSCGFVSLQRVRSELCFVRVTWCAGVRKACSVPGLLTPSWDTALCSDFQPFQVFDVQRQPLDNSVGFGLPTEMLMNISNDMNILGCK